MAITGAGWLRCGGALAATLLLLGACTGSRPESGEDQPALGGAPSPLARRLSRAVTVPGIRRHQRALDRIARLSNGNRAAGLPGIQAFGQGTWPRGCGGPATG